MYYGILYSKLVYNRIPVTGIFFYFKKGHFVYHHRMKNNCIAINLIISTKGLQGHSWIQRSKNANASVPVFFMITNIAIDISTRMFRTVQSVASSSCSMRTRMTSYWCTNTSTNVKTALLMFVVISDKGTSPVNN